MNEPVENKPVELSQEETKEVVGGATMIEFPLVASGIATQIIGVLGPLAATEAKQKQK